MPLECPKLCYKNDLKLAQARVPKAYSKHSKTCQPQECFNQSIYVDYGQFLTGKPLFVVKSNENDYRPEPHD